MGSGWPWALTAGGLLVVECERPPADSAAARASPTPIDAHLAVLAALRLDADHLPALRADGDREALRILLGARQCLCIVD